jgi:hypothetical protein
MIGAIVWGKDIRPTFPFYVLLLNGPVRRVECKLAMLPGIWSASESGAALPTFIGTIFIPVIAACSSAILAGAQWLSILREVCEVPSVEGTR